MSKKLIILVLTIVLAASEPMVGGWSQVDRKDLLSLEANPSFDKAKKTCV